MKSIYKKYALIAGLSLFWFQLAGAAEYENNGETIPKPSLQLGDKPSKPLPEDSKEVKGFINFFNKTYLSDANPIRNLKKNDIVWFPPQRVGDTSLEIVTRANSQETPNCDPGDPGYPPQGYPIVCQDDFSTGEFCQACHDSALFVEGGGLPQMSYFSKPLSKGEKKQHETWLVNWSQYGDWNTNIMRLATRDPIWQAQIETETNSHPYADPAVIQDVCFSCHGEMGERQLKVDHGPNQTFCTDVFYATIPGVLSKEINRGRPYPFTGDCEPIKGKSIEAHPDLYAKYGSLARDGVSCETCHRIGPEFNKSKDYKPGHWNGKDFEVFYGAKDTYNVKHRQTHNPVPLEYEFTATFQYDMNTIMTPDAFVDLDSGPMKQYDNLNIAQAVNEKNGESYLGQSVLCGSCHVLIVPQIPTTFKPGAPLPDTSKALKKKYPHYKRPESCKSDTFAPATNGKYGNPILDQCVGLGYEQATYLEWINSSFASENDNDNTCQGCHMPLVTDPSDPTNHTAIMAQSTQGLTPKKYRRHRLMGINLPVFEMFVQFPDVLGVEQHDFNVPPWASTKSGKSAKFLQNYLLNGQMAIVEQATSQANGNGLKPDSITPNEQAATEITIDTLSISDKTLKADLTVINNTGHKFPSGAGFRRAFLKFEVLNKKGNVVWVSGQTNPYGAICDGACVENNDGTYNLIGSEVNGGDPKKLQPHYSVISKQNQVQIYEVQSMNDTGELTSRTLSLFYDAKDNRLLPRGFKTSEELKCHDNHDAGTQIFGIKQCSAAYATDPQLKSHIPGSTIKDDKHYTNSKFAGSDTIKYHIPLANIKGTAASIRVTMEYQTIPPGYLASRFEDGYSAEQGAHLPATERSIYLTSHLNTNLKLKSEHPKNKDLTFSKNWTSSLFRATAELKH